MIDEWGQRPYWQGWDEDTLTFYKDEMRMLEQRRMEMQSIAEKLSWEIVAMNDKGTASEEARIALEICYGVACAIADPDEFLRVTRSIAEQVGNKTLKELIYRYAVRGTLK